MFGSLARRTRTPLVIALAGLVLLPSSAWAIRRPDHMRGHEELELFGPQALRSERVGVWGSSTSGTRARALARLEAEIGPVWARFDRDTGVVDTLIIRGGLPAPGSSASSEIAERAARALFDRHVELFAPGTDPSDLVLVADVDDGSTRTLGFVQTLRGTPVIGGQVSVRFANDRLTAIRSTALPHPLLPSRTALASDDLLQRRAIEWITADFSAGPGGSAQVDGAPLGPFLLPLVLEGGAIAWHEVVQVEVELDDPIGRWLVWLDAATGEPIARRSTLMWANLAFNVPKRSPVLPRANLPARHVNIDVAGETQTTGALDGSFLVAIPNSPAQFAANGTYVSVTNMAGPTVSFATVVAPGSALIYGDGNDEQLDAQLNAYIHAQLVKDRVRAIAPEFDYIDQKLGVFVNIDDVCNAFSDGDSINFFLSGGGCENSGRIADVIYHEFGHSVHTQALIPGVGLFDGAVSEGISDYLAATIVDDSKMGVGFFMNTEPIRDLDPAGFEWHWPEHKGEVHDEGRIIAGTLWDLRELMIAKHGAAEGVAETDRIWFESIRRAVDTPSMYVEALLANDDDGNLANGTPDGCVINQAFAAHGLYDPPLADTKLAVAEQADHSIVVELDASDPFPECPATLTPSLRWRPRPPFGQPAGTEQTVAMESLGSGKWRATIPAQPLHTVVQYQVALDWGNGTVQQRPSNLADPWYEHFIGPVTPLWCASFEGDEGWTSTGSFEIGAPQGFSGDPDGAFSGIGVAGNVLGEPGVYSPGELAQLRSPVIDVSGWKHVRLQYRRWLNIEDGFFDQAQIFADDQLAWRNLASADELFASNHHRDDEWRFHDIDLSPVVDDGEVAVAFKLISDGGLEFGGWNVDELCIVGVDGDAPQACGNGVLDPGEQCDDGNTQSGDGCAINCLSEEEEGGDESDTGETGDETQWEPGGRGCGCTATNEGRTGLLGFAMLGLLGFVRRRSGRA